jgi:hypothetical protein
VVPLAVCFAWQSFVVGAAPTLPLPEDVAASEPAPASEPATEPAAVDEPAAPSPFDGPAPPAAETPPAAAPARDTEVAPRAEDRDDDDDDDDTRGRRRTVRRAGEGDWGMQFTFGGLAPLSIAGIRDHGVNRLLMTELGFRRVTENFIIPFSIGAGVFHHNPEEGNAQNDAGLAASVGILKPFRVWRRISPYAGGMLHLHYLDPTGDNNWLVNFSIGPVIGTEFYIGDRVSLLFQGQFDVGANVFDGLTQVRAATSIAAGGQTGLVFYF